MFRKHAWTLFAIPLLGAFLGFILAAVISYVMPKMFESQALIELRPPPGSLPMSQIGFKSFIRTEMERMKDADILDTVINDLELTKRWAVDKSRAHDLLAKSVKINQVRGTDLVAIHVRHTNRIDARDLAIGIVNSYQKRRAESDTRIQRTMLSELQKAIREQEVTVEQNRRKLAGIARKKTANQESDEESLSKAATLAAAEQEFKVAQHLLESMKIKLISETIMAKNSHESVRIHNHPAEAGSPTTSNISRNLIIGSGLGILIGIPTSLFTLWLITRPERVFWLGPLSSINHPALKA